MWQFLGNAKNGDLWFFNFCVLLQGGALQINGMEDVDSGEVGDRQSSQGKK